MAELLIDPGTPYVGVVHGGRLSPGLVVKIKGVAPLAANRFNINLQCGFEAAPISDIGMQVSVRFRDGCMSLNSLQNGVWGEEQRCFKVPIKLAKKFVISLKCNFSQYQVAINDQHICDFPQRINYNRITHLAIDGDVSVIEISYTSALESEEETSEGNVYWIPHSPVAVPPVEIQNEIHDFEVMHSNSTVTPPPSYEAAMQRNEIGFVSGNTNANPPYSFTSTPYPAECNTVSVPSSTLYNINGTLSTPYPTAAPGTRYIASYTPSHAYEIPPPPPGAPIPLNTASSNFRPVQRTETRRCATIVGGVAIGLTLAIIAILMRKNKQSTPHNYGG